MNTRPNPYVGPRAFQPGEPFYGREHELRSLAALLIAERIVLLHSPSGSGKTSLIQAGLLPRLREDEFNVLPLIRINQEPPESVADLEGLNRYALSTLLSLEENVPEAQRLSLENLAALTIDEYLTRRPRPEGTSISEVLIFDQFEELLSIAPAERESKQNFMEQLGKALRNHDRWALVAIREDYLGALAPYTRPIPGRFGATFRLDLLDVEGALQAIQKPAQAQKTDFPTVVAQKLVDDLRRTQIQLPDDSLEEQLGPYVEPVQLQVVCYRLWQALSETDAGISAEDLAGVGDVNRSLADYYSSSLKSIAAKSGTSERVIREWFEHKLINTDGIRGQVMMGAEHSEGLPNAVARLIENAHLIRSEKRAGKTWFELSHDRLLKPVREDNATWFNANLSLFQQQAALWAQRGRPEGLLLRGKQLEQAERESTSLNMNEEERAFLEACCKLRRQEQREKLRTRLILGLAVGALLALVVAVIFGLRANASSLEAQRQAAAAQTSEARAVLNADAAATAQVEALQNADTAATAQVNAESQKQKAEQQARLARTGELALLASSLRSKDFQLSVLIGVEAFQSQDLPIAQRPAGQRGDEYQFAPVPERAYRAGKHAGLQPGWANTGLGQRGWQFLLWDVTTGKSVGQPLKGHNGQVLSVDFSPDGKLLASAGQDGKILLWDVASGKISGQPLTEQASAINSVAFSPDGKLLASGDDDAAIHLWDLATRKASGDPLEAHEASINDVEFSPDGRLLAAGDAEGVISLWYVVTREMLYDPLEGHEGSVNDLDFSPDGLLLASGSDDWTIVIWEVASGEPIAEPILAHEDSVNSVSFSADGKMLASGSDDNAIRIWDMDSLELIDQPSGGHKSQVQSVVFSPHGKSLASAGSDRAVVLWDLEVNDSLVGHGDQINDLAYSPDGKILASASNDETIRLWDLKTGSARVLEGHQDVVEALAFSPDGKILVSGGDDNNLRLWDVATGQAPGAPLSGHTDDILSVAYSPDGKILASGGSDESIILWDVATRQAIKHLNGHQRAVKDLAFSPDGKILASGSDDNTLILWDPASGKALGAPLSGQEKGVLSVAFSPDGKTLATGSGDSSIILWDVATRQAISHLYGHKGQVFSVVFSPDGKLLASGSDDGSLILWDLSTGEALGQPLLGDVNMITSVDFSPDGKKLAAEAYANAIYLWDLMPQAWVERACQRAGRNLTRAEWARYFQAEEYHSTCTVWPPAP